MFGQAHSTLGMVVGIVFIKSKWFVQYLPIPQTSFSKAREEVVRYSYSIVDVHVVTYYFDQ
jgi:hypothetical protein